MKNLRPLIVISVFTILGCLAVSAANDFSQPQAYASFQAMTLSAVTLAKQTGDGATITIGTSGKTTVVYLWAHRPIPGSTMEAAPRQTFTTAATIKLTGETTSPAILINSSGAASETSWAKGKGTLSADGTCTTSLTLTFSRGATSETHKMPCAAPQFLQ